MRLNISWAFAGNSIYAGCQWLVFVLLVRVLQAPDAGRFAYWVAVTGPIFVLANLRLRNLVATGVPSPHGFRDYLSARLLTTAGAVVLSLVLGWALAGSAGSLVVAALVAASKACEAVSDICHGLFQRELDMRSAAIGLIANGAVSVALVVLVLAVRPSLILAVLAYALGSLVALLAWDLPRLRRVSTPADPTSAGAAARLAAVRPLLRRAVPLGLSAAVGSLQSNLPRYLISAHLGPAALAVFTALAYLPTFGNLAANAVAQAALPALARDLRVSRAQFRTRLARLVLGGAALGALSVAAAAGAGRPLLTLMYGAEFARYSPVLIWLMTAAAVSYCFLFLGTATTARNRFGVQLLTSAAGLAAVACSIVPLVTRYGLAGAAIALVIGALVEASLYAFVTLHDLRAAGPSASAAPAEPAAAPLVNCHG